MVFIGCQKAEVWKKWPENTPKLLVEPKFDGYRLSVVIEPDGTLSYHCGSVAQPEWAENCTHIGDSLREIGLRGVMFDGELLAQDWGTTASLVRRLRSGMDAETKQQVSSELKYHCFDVVSLENIQTKIFPGKRKAQQFSDCSQDVRSAFVHRLVGYQNPSIVPTSHVEVFSEADLQQATARFLEQGYEGAMVKNPRAPYVFDRSSFWHKVKPWKDMELIVEYAVEGIGKHEGRLGSLICHTEGTHLPAACGTGFTDSQREHYWKLWKDTPEKLTGLRIEVQVQDSDVSHARHCHFKRERPLDC